MATEEWRNVLLEDLAAPQRNALVGGPFGSDLVSADYRPTGVPVIRGENVSVGRWVGGEFVFVAPSKAKQLEANTARPLDIVFTQRGANHFRQVAVVPNNAPQRFLISQSQMKLTVDPQKADPLYIYYCFRAPDQQNYLQRNAIQTGVPHTNLSILRKTPLRIPSVPIQRAIAEVLGVLDDKIELNRCMAETLEAMARALFRSWFVDFDPVRAKAELRPTGLPDDLAALFPNRFGEDGLPSGWTRRPLGELFEVSGGNTPSTGNPAFWNGPHQWATPKDLSSLTSPVLLQTERQLSDAGLRQCSSGLLPPRSLLLSSRAPIGYMAFAVNPTAINQGFAGIIRKDTSTAYAWGWCDANMDVIIGNAGGSTFPEISKSVFRQLLMLVPSQPLLQTFGDAAEPLIARIVASVREQETLAVLRDTLLPKLISGELRIADAEKSISA
jgi:type I restriction enzyme S subunit